MKLHFYSILPFLSCVLFLQRTAPNTTKPSPLAVFSAEWNHTKYLHCNTAAKAAYMNEDEKSLIHILNLARTNPVLFANTVVQKYPDHTGQGFLQNIAQFKSLLDTLRKLKPLPLLYPDSLCFISARCHAIASGRSAYVGHERKTQECKANKYYYGECCDYGHREPLQILMSLLIDQYVSSLGHRYICLGNYKKIGISIQPHSRYGTNAVLDFSY